uniref:Uncharacterized protein n=1 Tax=Romanomermis culicivorax TaxID=13658 RepID=A0A915IM44_ROMCU
MPLILAGNKCDVTNKKIYPSTVQAWLNHFTSRKDIKYLECSAKEDQNIDLIFKLLFQQSNFIHSASYGDAASKDSESAKVFHSSSFKHSVGTNATPLTHRRLHMHAKGRLVNEKIPPSDQSPTYEDSSNPIYREFIKKNNIANRTQSDQCCKTNNHQNEPPSPDSSSAGQQDAPSTPDSPIVRNSQFYRTLSCRRGGGLYSPSKNAAANTKRSSVTEVSSGGAGPGDNHQFSMDKAGRLGETCISGGHGEDGKNSLRLTRHVSLMRKGDERGGSRSGKLLKLCPNTDMEDDLECKVS